MTLTAHLPYPRIIQGPYHLVSPRPAEMVDPSDEIGLPARHDHPLFYHIGYGVPVEQNTL